MLLLSPVARIAFRTASLISPHDEPADQDPECLERIKRVPWRSEKTEHLKPELCVDAAFPPPKRAIAIGKSRVVW